MYQLSDIRLSYEGFSLRIENLTIGPGKLYVMVSPNGTGKSTFLNLLGFLGSPSKGQFFFKSERIDYKNGAKLLECRRKVSYLLQNPYLFSRNVFDNVASGLKIRKLPEKKIREKTGRMLEMLALSHLSKRSVGSLSGGEAQRVALARTLVIDADVYLLDEPTANVDRENIHLIEEVIRSIGRDNQTTVVLTTHSREQAYRMSDSLISIINGKVKDLPYENVFSGTAEEDGDLKVLPLTESVRIKFGSAKTGNVTIAIDPNIIILSKEPVVSSALNSFKGTIHKIEDYNGSLQVFVDTGVPFCTLITQKSFVDLGLNIGSEIWVTFKANSVIVI